MAINPLIARGYQGGVVNAFFDGQNQRLERERYQQQTLAAAQQRDMLAKYAEMEQYAAAPPELKAQYVESQKRLHPEFASSPLASLAPEEAFEAMRRGLAAKVGKPYDGSMYQQQRMAGLEDIPISRPKIDEKAVFDRGMKEREFAADEQYRKRSLGLQYAQEARLSRPQAGGEDEFARYQAMTPEQRDLYDRMKGRNKGGGITVGPDGELMVDLNKMSEGERVSAGYLGRMRSAEGELRSPGLSSYVPSTPAFMAFASLLDDDTGITGATVANGVMDDADRAYMGQALDFILAKMRKESGATIKGGEFRKEYINYFPLPNDSPEEIQRKARKREIAMKQLEISAGRAEPLSEKMTASSTSFASEAEAEAAAKAGKLKAGDRITIGGVSGTWQ